MLSSGQTRLLLNLDDLRSYNRETAANFMRQPAEYLPAFEEAMREIIASYEPSLAKQGATSVFRIGVTGSFGEAQGAHGARASARRRRLPQLGVCAAPLLLSRWQPVASRMGGPRMGGLRMGKAWHSPRLSLCPPCRSASFPYAHAVSPTPRTESRAGPGLHVSAHSPSC